MTVHYSKLVCAALIALGALSTALHVWLALLEGRGSLSALPGLLAFVAGGLMLGRPAITFDDGRLGLRNLLGMELRSHALADLEVEGSGARRRLFLRRAGGKRRRVLAEPSLAYDRAETAALLDAIAAARG